MGATRTSSFRTTGHELCNIEIYTKLSCFSFIYLQTGLHFVANFFAQGPSTYRASLAELLRLYRSRFTSLRDDFGFLANWVFVVLHSVQTLRPAQLIHATAYHSDFVQTQDEMFSTILCARLPPCTGHISQNRCVTTVVPQITPGHIFLCEWVLGCIVRGILFVEKSAPLLRLAVAHSPRIYRKLFSPFDNNQQLLHERTGRV